MDKLEQAKREVLEMMRKYNAFLSSKTEPRIHAHHKGIVKGLHIALDIIREVEYEHPQE